MKFKVTKFMDEPHNFHKCTNENGRECRLDLFTNGDFPKGTDPFSLEGKTINVESTVPYVSIASGVSIVEESGGVD